MHTPVAPDLLRLRHELHQQPELSGLEVGTAARIRDFCAPDAADEVLTGLGGTGLALVFEGASEGPVVMIRAELDGLPIPEIGELAYKSTVAGQGHLCGHDGHMAILAGVSHALGRRRPLRGKAVLLFQPAEENGAGAAAVIADPRFARIAPDYAFALHNLPGLPLGVAVLEEGAANCASVGLRVVLQGRTAHAAEPQNGVSPAAALVDLVPALTALCAGIFPDPDFRLATVTHLRLGAPSFGITPGEAELWLTLRALGDSGMAALKAAALADVQRIAGRDGLGVACSWHDDFAACNNHPEATRLLRAALRAEGVDRIGGAPMRASEDFGRFGAGAASAMFWFGAGEDHPALHNPDYDFPDALIAPGVRVFTRVIRDILG